MTEKYCLDRGISFPRIEVSPEDMKEPHECYLFAKAEDPSSPIILHFPLVNRTFRTHLAPGEGSLGSGSGPSIHGTFQARTLEWVAIAFSRVSSRSRD